MSSFDLELGGLADPIEKQLRKQGLALVSPKNADKISHAITYLAVHCILTDSQKGQARQKLVKRIRVAPLQGTKP